MVHIPHKSRSIDGFVPTQRERHVGFVPQRRIVGGQPNATTRDIRTRLPGLHQQAPVTPEQHQILPGVNSRMSPLSRASSVEMPKVEPLEPADRTPLKHGRRFMRRHTSRPKPKGFRARLRNVRWKKVLTRSLIVIAIVGITGGGWIGWKAVHATGKAFGGNVLGFLSSTKLDGEDQGRVNILLTGVSTDDVGHDGANLTDSIMVISLDTRNNKAMLLSVPRDLWVNIPGYGYAKINAANAYGDNDNFQESGYPSGGIGLLEKVIYQNFNLKMNYYAKINYGAIRDGVNAVGGIDFTVKSSDPRGLYDPSIDWTTKGPLVKLTNGVHHLNGQQALDLARARGDAYGSYGFPRSDFDRTDNQRQMMLALKDKITSSSVLSNPLKIGQLFDTLGKNVVTNFKTGEVRRLYELGKKIGNGDITSASLNDADGVNLLASYSGTGGQSALIPAAGIDDFSQIQAYIKRLFSNDPIVKESAKVAVLNGGNVTGLASKEKNALTAKNINVVSTATASATAKTIIIDNSKDKMPKTKEALVARFGNNVTTTNSYGYPTADFIVVLGADYKDPSATQ